MGRVQKKTHFPQPPETKPQTKQQTKQQTQANFFPGKFFLFGFFFYWSCTQKKSSPGTNSAARVGGCRAKFDFFMGFARWPPLSRAAVGFFFSSKIAPRAFFIFTSPAWLKKHQFRPVFWFGIGRGAQQQKSPGSRYFFSRLRAQNFLPHF